MSEFDPGVRIVKETETTIVVTNDICNADGELACVAFNKGGNVKNAMRLLREMTANHARD